MYIGVSRSLRTQCELCFHDSHSDLGNHAEVADALIPPLGMFIYCWSNQRLLLCSVWACICVFVLLRMCFMRMIPLSFLYILVYAYVCAKCAHVYIIMFLIMCVCVYIYLCIRISVYSFLFVCIRVRVHMCVFICLCACEQAAEATGSHANTPSPGLGTLPPFLIFDSLPLAATRLRHPFWALRGERALMENA